MARVSRLSLPIEGSEHQRLVAQVANLCASQFFQAGTAIGAPAKAADVARSGDTMQSGMLLAALELRDLLAQSPDGRQALRDLGFEPILQHIEGK